MKLPMMLQTEAAECGLACLAMIATSHGFRTDVVTLRKRFPISGQGVNLKQIVDIAGAMQFSCRPLRAEIEELGSISLPCVLHWGLDHFVVLKHVSTNYYIVHDPACGVRKISLKEFSRQFTGIVLELTPNHEFERAAENSKLRIRDLLVFRRDLGGALLIILVLSVLAQFLSMLAPFYVQLAIDKIIEEGNKQLLLPMSLGFLFVLVSLIVVTLLREFSVIRISNLLSLKLAANLFNHVIRLPLDYFQKRHLGDVISRFSSLTPLRQFFTTGIVGMLLDVLMAITSLLVLFSYSAVLTGVVLTVAVAYLCIRILFYRPIKQLNEERLLESARENTHFMESIRGIQTLKIFQKETDRQGQWLNRLVNVLNKDIAINKWTLGFAASNTLLFGLENIIVVYLASRLVLGQQLTLGMFFAYLTYKMYFTNAMNSLITQIINFKMLDIHLERISDMVFTAKESATRKPTEGEYISVVGKIEVRNLAYRFSPIEANVFENVTFSVNAGETLAITGPSGCGKTTLLKCLAGLLAPTEGEILIDGIPLSMHTNYRSQIATVMQDDDLLSGSIAENIALFESPIDLEKVYRCAAMACVDEDIRKMPMQYNTLVGDMGSVLSGGQKQRIVLARALYREPRILFMDEATSHLDVDNEAHVNKNIGDLSITRILVAHRPETVRSAGKHFVM